MRALFLSAKLALLVALFPALAGCTMESKFANDAKPTVRVAVARDGTSTVDGAPATAEDLTARAHERASAHFVVDADREVTFEVLLATLERLRAGGATDIALGVALPSRSASHPE